VSDGGDLVAKVSDLVGSVAAVVKSDTFVAEMKLARRAGAQAQIDALLGGLVSGLRAVHRLVVGISRALRSAAPVLDQADALLALLEVGVAMLESLAQLTAGALPGLGVPAGPLDSIGDAMDTDELQRVVGRLPSLDEVRAIQAGLDDLVGPNADPQRTDGSLAELLAAVSMA